VVVRDLVKPICRSLTWLGSAEPSTRRKGTRLIRIGVTFSVDNNVFTGKSADMGLLTGKSADIILASGGDYMPGSPIEKHNQTSGYLRQVLAWIGVTDVNIILASRALAGVYGETAVERLGEVVRAAAVRELAAPSFVDA
jgi:FMN-dependent NADH-azoreductase